MNNIELIEKINNIPKDDLDFIIGSIITIICTFIIPCIMSKKAVDNVSTKTLKMIPTVMLLGFTISIMIWAEIIPNCINSLPTTEYCVKLKNSKKEYLITKDQYNDIKKEEKRINDILSKANIAKNKIDRDSSKQIENIVEKVIHNDNK